MLSAVVLYSKKTEQCVKQYWCVIFKILSNDMKEEKFSENERITNYEWSKEISW